MQGRKAGSRAHDLAWPCWAEPQAGPAQGAATNIVMNT